MKGSPPTVVSLGVHRPDDGSLRPARPARDAALARVRGLLDPRAAWQALGYAEESERVFRLVADAPVGADWVDASSLTPNLDGGPSGLLRCFVLDTPYPHSVEEAVAFAADAANIVVVERLAREYARAVAPWISTSVEPTKIAWRFLQADGELPRLARTTSVHIIAECLEAALETAGITVEYARGQIALPLGTLWRDASARGLVVPRELEDPYFLHGALGPPFVPETVQGRRFADLVDPFAPLERIAALGYRIEGLDDRDLTILAAAPAR